MSTIAIEAYVIDCLLPDLIGHDRLPSAFVVYLCLYSRASQHATWSVRLSHQAIAQATGLSRSAVQKALTHLQKRELIATSRAHPTAVPLHKVQRPWLRLGKKGQ
jgi:CRP-like cAMP-binding protein